MTNTDITALALVTSSRYLWLYFLKQIIEQNNGVALEKVWKTYCSAALLAIILRAIFVVFYDIYQFTSLNTYVKTVNSEVILSI